MIRAMTDVFPSTRRGYEDFNDFAEMLPLGFSKEVQGLKILDRKNPEHNYSAFVYEPHVRKLLSKREAMTRRQWAEVVRKRRITDDDDWVKLFVIRKARVLNSFLPQAKMRVAKISQDDILLHWMRVKGLTAKQDRIDA